METLQNSHSAFRELRLKADYKTSTALARQVGVNRRATDRWESGERIPRWGQITKLSEVLHEEPSHLVRLFWNENIGDPCVHGWCGGHKVFPNSATAQCLSIEVPCAKCQKKRVFAHGILNCHRSLCVRCVKLVDPSEFTCDGYDDHHAKNCHARKCPYTRKMRPCEVREYKKRHVQKATPWQRPFIDEATKTYRCLYCASASWMNWLIEQKMKRITDERIESRNQRKEIAKQYSDELFPELTRFTKETRHQKKGPHSEEHTRNRVKARLLKEWSGETLPHCYHFARCLFCGGPVMSEKPSNFHRRCYREWLSTPAGRRYQSLHRYGETASLPSRGAGRPEDLKTIFAWCIQRAAGKSVRQIAKTYRKDSGFVDRKTNSFITELRAVQHLLPRKFHLKISLLTN